MYDLTLVGIGSGNPEHLTQEAIRALNAMDLILIPNKGAGKDDLAALRHEICEAVLTSPAPQIVEFDQPERDTRTQDYLQRVDDWHDVIAELWWHNITTARPDGGKIGFLVWGDPSLYDSTMRIAKRLKSRADVQIKVIPGITSVQALTAAHAVPLNEINGAVTLTTGRQVRDFGWPASADTVVVMLDGQCSFQTLPSEGLYIWWTAYAGMKNEISIHGPVHQVRDQILATRARAREKHGWLMDIYMLRRNLHTSDA